MRSKKVIVGPILRSRPARYDKATGKLTHRGNFFIEDGAKQTATGCSFGNDTEYAAAEEAALEKLHEYNVQRYALKAAAALPKSADISAENVLIGDLIVFYLTRKKEKIDAMAVERRREHLSQIECLMNFWGTRNVVEINEVNSMAYQLDKKPSVVRNKIIVLKSIINYAAAQSRVKLHEGQLDYAQPSRSKSRIDIYKVDELIAMYKAARRRRRTWRENRPEFLERKGEKWDDQVARENRQVAVHIARFLLVAVLTGTRADRIGQASFIAEAGRPWVDLENGIFYRAALGEDVAPNKRADPVRIPIRLLRMMRRWHAGNMVGSKPSKRVKPCRYLIEFNGRPVDCRKGFYTLKNEVLSPSRAKVLNRHSLKHTAVTMLLAEGVSVDAVARYVSTTPEIIRAVYDQYIPDEMSEVHRALAKKQPSRKTKAA